MRIFCVGPGPSATTVQAPLNAITAGSSVVIQGTVMDISAGTTQAQQSADFPNGVPCASDASMTDWMGYGPNGNPYSIGKHQQRQDSDIPLPQPYFNNLSVEKNKSLPIWIVELYNSKNETDWNFKGQGIVFINEITKDVIVLEADKHLESPLPEIQTTEYGKSKFNVPENINFCQWFEISYTDKNRIIAEYKIHISDIISLINR
jgi:hypothetical protein